MIKVLLIVLLCLSTDTAIAQTQKYNCVVITNNKTGNISYKFEFKKNIAGLEEDERYAFLDEKGEMVYFKCPADAAQYLIINGWKFKEVIASENQTMKFFYKDAASKEEAMKGIVRLKAWKNPQGEGKVDCLQKK
ncbi:hypothetical protein [Prevotella sp. KH2C16]|uniref:hypothetical protein n=1 Tax=Prevotella sp. KH2C16 TaxID=1855325 RepID=UPI0008EA37D1|nr:hypothetical protein [Prevotella sp. KH2C16]SFG66465.1 hypothetical protein SAMN05216383_12712 [Prevotella sp. KH2C16]